MMEYMESKMQEQIEAGVSERERCYNEIAELEHFRDALAAKVVEVTAERDALAAQVEVLGDKLSEVVALLDVDGMTAVQWLLDNCPEIESLTGIEPEHHLAEIRAEAGRKGFVAGSEQTANFITGEIGYVIPLLEARANQYADKIRQEK